MLATITASALECFDCHTVIRRGDNYSKDCLACHDGLVAKDFTGHHTISNKVGCVDCHNPHSKSIKVDEKTTCFVCHPKNKYGNVRNRQWQEQ